MLNSKSFIWRICPNTKNPISTINEHGTFLLDFNYGDLSYIETVLLRNMLIEELLSVGEKAESDDIRLNTRVITTEFKLFNKILVIGHHARIKSSKTPYNNTMFYDWLNLADVTKELVPELFEFEGIHNKRSKGKATREDVDEYYTRVLKDKINNSDKVIILGNTTRNYLLPKCKNLTIHTVDNTKYLCLPHPNNRNKHIYEQNKTEIKFLINKFL